MSTSSTITDFFGIPTSTTLARLNMSTSALFGAKETEDEPMNPEVDVPPPEENGGGGGGGGGGALLAVALLPLIMSLLWMISLIMTGVSASKLNTSILTGKLAALPEADRDFIPKIGSAASFLWWAPFVNIITASIFTHKVRVNKL